MLPSLLDCSGVRKVAGPSTAVSAAKGACVGSDNAEGSGAKPVGWLCPTGRTVEPKG